MNIFQAISRFNKRIEKELLRNTETLLEPNTFSPGKYPFKEIESNWQLKSFNEVFECSVLASEIAKSVGKMPTELMTENDRNEIVEVSLPNKYITSLSGITHLINLSKLYLSHNELSGEIPPALGKLQNLKYLDLSCNKLSGEIPPELGELQKLMYLDVRDNRLSGPIPSVLPNCIW